VLTPGHLVITRANGSILEARRITGIVVSPTRVQVTLEEGAFAREEDVTGTTVATRAYYHNGAGAAIPVSISK
jgi:hypothetical protein